MKHGAGGWRDINDFTTRPRFPEEASARPPGVHRAVRVSQGWRCPRGERAQLGLE